MVNDLLPAAGRFNELPDAISPARLTLAAVLGAGCLIVMGELNRLIASSLGGSQSRSLFTFIGPTGFTAKDSWEVWEKASAGQSIPVFGWILMFTVVDLVFIACYGYLMLRIAGFDDLLLRSRFWRREATRFQALSVLALVGSDVLEDLVHLSLILAGAVPGQTAACWLWSFSALKWLAVVWVLLVFVRKHQIRAAIAAYLAKAAHAVYTHRLAFLVLLILGTLSLVPLGNIFDQLPDVQRQWLDGAGTGIRHAVAAIMSLLLVSGIFFLMGRWRSRLEWMTYVHSSPPRERASVGWWVLPPFFIGLGLILSSVFYGVTEWLLIVYAVPALLVLAVFLLARCFRIRWITKTAHAWFTKRRHDLQNRTEAQKLVHRRRAEFTIRTGDVLAVLLFSVGSLGLVRAFAAPTAITMAGYGLAGNAPAGALGPFVAGVVGMLIVPVVGMRWASRHTFATTVVPTGEPGPPVTVESPSGEAAAAGSGNSPWSWMDSIIIGVNDQPGATRNALRVVVLFSMVFLLGTALWPFDVAGFLGVAAMTTSALGAWSLLIGSIVLSLQQERPPAAFEIFHFRASPVLTLLLIPPILAGLNGGIAAFHAIRTIPVAAVASVEGDNTKEPNQGLNELIVASAWDAWKTPTPPAQATGACPRPFLLPASSVASGTTAPQTKPTGGDTPAAPTGPPIPAPAALDEMGSGREFYVRPVLLVAAEGGGIRAAFWTGRTMEEMAKADPCLAGSVMLSSGVSGGSLGLVLSATVGTGATTGDISSELNQLADSRTLSTAMAGYLVGDGIATMSGIRIPSHSNGSFAWYDRAALIELSWESRAKNLADPATFKPSVPAGTLLLNSTDAVTGCKVIVGLRIPAKTEAAGASGRTIDCDAAGSGAAAAISFQQLTGPASCPTVRWSTAAMLSARFPFVTPAGRLPGVSGRCASPDLVQLVDGGYADNTGLSTLADLAPEVAEKILQANTAADGSIKKPFILPILMYLQNSTGGDIKTEGNKTAEPLIAFSDGRIKKTQVSSDAWIQRIVVGLDNVCPTTNMDCRGARTKFWNTIPSGVVLVSPTTRPSIAPPLGWTLSSLSRDNLNAAFVEQISTSCMPEPVGRLGDLLALTTAKAPEGPCR